MSALAYPLAPADVAALVRASVPGLERLAPAEGCCDADATGHGEGGAVVAIGAFDGVHRGHQELIGASVREARACGVRSVVVTFDPDPSELVAPEAAERRLLAVRDRVALCRALGCSQVLVLPFDEQLAACSPAQFVDRLLAALGPLRSVHVGSNFHFGCRGAGTVDTLRALGTRGGFAVVAHDLLEVAGAPVSSTRIRGLLDAGRVGEAAMLLGRCHMVRGTVAHGRGEGTSFGFPTANVCCDARDCLPAEGVYACIVTDGKKAWPAAANVGAPPTFSAHRDAFLEANLIGFAGDLYGRELAVVFVEWLRASRPFDSLDELERVVLGNIGWVRDNLGDTAVEVAS